jgi:hypothetical protein
VAEPAAVDPPAGLSRAAAADETVVVEPPPLDVLPTRDQAESVAVLRSLAQSVPGRQAAPEPDLVVPLPPKRPPRPPKRERRWNTGLTVAVTVLLLVLFVGLVRAEGGTGGPVATGLPGLAAAAAPAQPRPKPAAPKVVTIPAQVSSVDPTGGSGFRREDGSWRTQSYNSPTFGNLKDGVGLLLDLGAPRAVTEVRLDAEGPLDLELRAGDEPTDDGGSYAEVSTADGADGAVALSGAKGGKHRYWLVWVTSLAPGDGGHRAVLSTPAVRGPAG